MYTNTVCPSVRMCAYFVTFREFYFIPAALTKFKSTLFKSTTPKHKLYQKTFQSLVLPFLFNKVLKTHKRYSGVLN